MMLERRPIGQVVGLSCCSMLAAAGSGMCTMSSAGGQAQWAWLIPVLFGCLYRCVAPWKGVRYALGVAAGWVGLAMILLVAGRALQLVYVREPRQGWIGEVCASMFQCIFRFVAHIDSGRYAVYTEEGVNGWSATPEKVCLGPLCLSAIGSLLWEWFSRGQVPTVKRCVVVAAFVAMHAVLYGIVVGAIVLGMPDLHVAKSPPVAAWYLHWCPTTVAVALLNWCCMRTAGEHCRKGPTTLPVKVKGGIYWRRAACCVLLCAIGSGLVWKALLMPLVGVRGGHRLMIDDSLSGDWAPASRMFTEMNVGDFGAYGYGVLAEQLGHYYDVVVSERRPSRSDLETTDCLIVKTPTEDIDDETCRSIKEWVGRGGVLICLGDHTDLLGTTSRLNRMVSFCASSFRADYLSGVANGGFSYIWPETFWGNGILRAGPLEFMTGCSIACSWQAVELVLATGQHVRPADYSKGNNFGEVSSDLDRMVGTMCLACVEGYERGSVVLIGDSTWLSAFALYSYDRFEVFKRLVDLALNTRPLNGWLRLVMLLCGVCCLGSAVALWANEAWTAAAVIGGMLWVVMIPRAMAVWDGVELGGSGLAAQSCSRVDLIGGPGVYGWYPPSLGPLAGRVEVPVFDSLAVTMMRFGVLPRLVGWREAFDAVEPACVVWPNPVEIGGGMLEAAAKEYVKRGGVLVVLLGSRKYGRMREEEVQMVHRIRMAGGAGGEKLGPCWSSGGCGVMCWRVNKGMIIAVDASDGLTRDGLGHCMGYPTREQRERTQLVGSVMMLALRDKWAALEAWRRRAYHVLRAGD